MVFNALMACICVRMGTFQFFGNFPDTVSAIRLRAYVRLTEPHVLMHGLLMCDLRCPSFWGLGFAALMRTFFSFLGISQDPFEQGPATFTHTTHSSGHTS